jgi:hypothetical protein
LSELLGLLEMLTDDRQRLRGEGFTTASSPLSEYCENRSTAFSCALTCCLA